MKGIVCKVRTQDPENFHEEVKSLVTAWCSFFLIHQAVIKTILFLRMKAQGSWLQRS